MVIIYCIEDINDLKYVGSTKQKLHKRFSQHKKIDNPCSSKLLNIHNSIIYCLEECEESQRHEREKYWINKLDTVNLCKLDSEDRPSINRRRKRHYDKNKDKILEKKRLKYLEKKDKINEKRRLKYLENKDKINEKRRLKYLEKKSKSNHND